MSGVTHRVIIHKKKNIAENSYLCVFLLSQALFYHSLSPQTIFGVVWSMLCGKMSISTFSASTLDVSRHMFMGIMGEPDHLERFGCFLCVYWVMLQLFAAC